MADLRSIILKQSNEIILSQKQNIGHTFLMDGLYLQNPWTDISVWYCHLNMVLSRAEFSCLCEFM